MSEEVDLNSKELIDAILKEFEREFIESDAKMTNLSIPTLERLSMLSESIEGKLKRLYSVKFPKKCNNCGMIYNSRAEYLQQTKAYLDRHNSIMEKTRVLEFRDCLCGSTLVVVTEDRRDNTPFGVARRKLFDLCVERAVLISGSDKSVVIQKMREIFRDIINRATSEPGNYFKKK